MKKNVIAGGLAITVAILLTIVLLSNSAWASDIASGACGGNLTWVLNSEGTMTISGTGNMDDYSVGEYTRGTPQPWESYRDKIKKVVILDGVTSVGTEAFGQCDSLTEVTIAGSVGDGIGWYAFYDCDNLKTVILQKGITNIDDYTFLDCKRLSYVEIPDGVTSISEGTFRNCDSLIWIKIPDSVTSMITPFYWCDNLQHILYTGTEEQWNAIDIRLYPDDDFLNITRHYNAIEDVEGTASCTFGYYYCPICAVEIRTQFDSEHNFVNNYCTECGVEYGWQYRLSDDDKGIVVTGYPLRDYNGNWIEKYDYYLPIPDEIEGFPVVEIAMEYMYHRCIYIPESVNQISLSFMEDVLWHILYGGSVEQWRGIVFDTGSEWLNDVMRHNEATGSEVISHGEYDCIGHLCAECQICGEYVWDYKYEVPKHEYDNDSDVDCNNCGEERVVTEPPVTEPPVTEPPATEPPATEPPATEPPVTEPPATEPPATEPPATEPPATEPPATEPPATEPPATEPPATEPPATEPPATEPPATEPPATEPPATKPTGNNTGLIIGGVIVVVAASVATVIVIKRKKS